MISVFNKNATRGAAGACIVAVALSGCSWVELTEEGADVKVMASAIAGCERVGSTTSMTKSDIASIDRNREKVALELETLARNAAARLDGDAVVPETDVSAKGEQTFGIFRCGS